MVLTTQTNIQVYLTLIVPTCSIIILKYIHSSNTSTTFYKLSTGPKHVACGYFVKVVDVLDECIYFMIIQVYVVTASSVMDTLRVKYYF